MTGGPGLLDGTSRGLDPRVRVAWALSSLLPILAVGGGFLVAAIITDRAELAPWILAATAVAAVGAVGWSWARYARFSWAAWPDALQLRHGVLTRHESVVPYHRIQQIDLQRGPLDRALGLSSLVLRTAAATTDARIPGIDAGHADELRHRLVRRSGADDAV